MKHKVNVSDINLESREDRGSLLDVKIKPYQAPVLICYGDVRDITLGPTFGGGESGCEGLFRVGPGGCPPP